MNNTILIVDDMALNIDMLADMLRSNYSIMAATSGEKAIKLLERRKPDLVLLDISMPGFDGFEVLRFMKEHDELSSIPVIFVTGEHDSYAEEKGLTLGAVDYIKKPYNAAIVGIKVRNHLELKNYRDNLELLVQERTKQLAASREAVIMAMSLMSESRDRITGDHIVRIKYYTRILALRVYELYPEIITADMVNQMVLYSPLHDIGKIGISDNILKKAGVLTSEEREIMQTHTQGGAELLRKAESFLVDNEDGDLSVAVEIAECHHEKYDGSGYPRRLKGDEIPLSARVVSVADVYDALRSPRPYKKEFSHSEAVDIILSGDDRTNPKHFDSRILEVFVKIQDEFESVYEQ